MKSSEFPTADRQPPKAVQNSLTVLLPRLSGWIPQLAAAASYPALEILLARADATPPQAAQLDQLRLKLFGLVTADEVPVAVLSLLAADALAADDTTYGLRMDPAILHADPNRVMLMRTGFAGFPVSYQQQVRDIVRDILAAEDLTSKGIKLEADDDGWILRLTEHPGLKFVSIDDAIGADISDCLPEGDAGRFWKRLQNEIQIALHTSAANQSRRQVGEAVINSVWFWGGGSLPEASESRAYDCVYSLDPVSRGLACFQGSELKPLNPFGGDRSLSENPLHGSTFVDWAIPISNPHAAACACTPERLDAFCVSALAQLKQQGGVLELHSPEKSWRLQARQLWRVWRRPKPLAQQLTLQLNSSETAL